jgi:hypothetical protein
MRFVTTREASRLTGLSTDQLREWTNRRALIPADVRPKGHGSPAQYTWQTILMLRLAAVLHEHFHVELQAHRKLFTKLRQGLHGMSFPGLWGKSLALYGGEQWALLDDQSESEEAAKDAIVLRLDPHLEVLSAGFALPNASPSAGQLELFPVRVVASGGSKGASKANRANPEAERRRGSA